MVREYNKHLNLADLMDINIFSVPKMKHLTLLEKYPTLAEMKWMPDNDDVGFRINTEFKVHKRLLFFNFVSKNILSN